MKKRIEELFRESLKTKTDALNPAVVAAIEQTAGVLIRCLRAGGKIMSCGNGGSASDAMHFTGEMVGRFRQDRPPLAAMTLNTDAAVMTAVGNDYSFSEIFSRQVRALGCPGDVLLVFSTSGNSPNILSAIEAGREKTMKVLGLLGHDGGKAKSLLDTAVIVPGNGSWRIQEVHGLIVHILCDLVENEIFGTKKPPLR